MRFVSEVIQISEFDPIVTLRIPNHLSPGLGVVSFSLLRDPLDFASQNRKYLKGLGDARLLREFSLSLRYLFA